MKYCYACKQNRPVGDFGKNQSKKDGLSTECRGCKRKIDKEYHAANRNERCKKMRAYWNNNLEHCQEKGRAYSRSEVGRENNNGATRKYYKKHREECLVRMKRRNVENPEKYKAEYQIRNAIKLGKITRPSHCQVCDERGLPEAHHPDYSKPFDIIWLCKKCHGKVHRKRD